MKVCLIMAGDEEGGLENHVIDLANALANNHEVHLIAHPRYAGRCTGVGFHALDLTRGRRNPWLLYRVARLIRAIRPDIVHAHANKATSIIARLRPFLGSHARLVATLHSQKRRLHDFARMDLVIGVSERVLLPIEGPRKAVVYPGLSGSPAGHSRAQARHSLQLAEEQPVIAAVGRLVPVKRFDILLNALAGLEKVQLLLVGEGSQRAALEQQATQAAPGRVTLLGQREDVGDILAAADLCVISSEREGFSFVMAEALQAGTPVISTDVADMHRILPAGYVVPVNDPAALQQAIAGALQNPEETHRVFMPCFEWARAQLVLSRVIGQINGLYAELMEERRV
ncbi:MAG: glycosyltransferase [Halobacteria archaeon]|nr:glycosyltransferase [Halobacteria archaeon]